MSKLVVFLLCEDIGYEILYTFGEEAPPEYITNERMKPVRDARVPEQK
jgi:hypothetical protein